MPDVGPVQPTKPSGSGPEKAPEDGSLPAGETPQSFKAHLEAKLAARRARKAVPQAHIEEMIRFFNKMGEAFESVRLVTKYPPIEKDDALYEVRTDRGTHRLIRARNGSYTIFQ
jgi:hypothetical protein